MPSIGEGDSKDGIPKSKKRRRVETNGRGAGNDAEKLNGAIINVDDLDWKSVELPDRLDDAEGFLGLEEIEGVDIVRPHGTGRVKFRVRIRLKLFGLGPCLVNSQSRRLRVDLESVS
jgi:ATP-dependent RNA helicase DDX24/MAK5